MITQYIKKILSIITKRNVLFIPKYKQGFLHSVKSAMGFWYCGNLYDTSDIAYGIAINGLVEEQETKLVTKILRQLPEDYIFIDIGANSGYYGIMSSFISSKSKTYSFEPLKEHCDLIRESAKINQLNNIEINEHALGKRNEDKNIYIAGSGTTLIKDFTGDIRGVNKIVIKRLDDVILQKNISNAHFIKIDVEGFEFEVLQGATKMIEKFKPILFIEICHTKNGNGRKYINPNFRNTFIFLENLGYTASMLSGDTLKSFNKETTPNNGVWMFLFIHKTNHNNITL